MTAFGNRVEQTVSLQKSFLSSAAAFGHLVEQTLSRLESFHSATASWLRDVFGKLIEETVSILDGLQLSVCCGWLADESLREPC